MAKVPPIGCGQQALTAAILCFGVFLLCIPIGIFAIFYVEDPLTLERALRQYDRSRAEVIQVLGEPAYEVTREEIDSGKTSWPPEETCRRLKGKPEVTCLVFNEGNRYFFFYFDANGRCYRVQQGYS